jgi:L-lysine 2,3-aminomutase
VLLRGVNDSVDVLENLSKTLVDLGVMPYYLHLLDRTRGTHAFDVQEAEGKRLIGELRARLPGYAVPRLAREIAGATSKQVVL